MTSLATRPASVPQAYDLDATLRLAENLIQSRMLPDAIKTPQQAMMIILKGRELGVPPVYALTHINIIQGKPSASPEMMLALIHQKVPGATVKFKKLSREGCEIHAKRPEEDELTVITFDQEDARLAGLLNKQNWRSYPRAMYRSRAVAEMARTVFPDAISGVSYTPEELGADVRVADDGLTIEVVPEKTRYDAKDAAHRGRVVEIAKGLGLNTRAEILAVCNGLPDIELEYLEAAVKEFIEDKRLEAAKRVAEVTSSPKSDLPLEEVPF